MFGLSNAAVLIIWAITLLLVALGVSYASFWSGYENGVKDGYKRAKYNYMVANLGRICRKCSKAI